MKKVKNSIKYSKSFFDEKDVQLGLFFVGVSSYSGYFLAKNTGGGEYAPYLAVTAGMTSAIDVVLKYFEITDSFYLTGALLGIMGGFQTFTNHKSKAYVKYLEKGGDSSSADQIIGDLYPLKYLAAHVGVGVVIGLDSAYWFGWFTDKVTNKFGNITLPYSERYKNIINEEDTTYIHENFSYDEI
ncbi:hypothetical protein H1Q59_03615 [Holosporaceae bacterium 'Namur']|nr:hypothetical protein [Holosporaceae bacterium 'Namur']